MFRLIEVDFWDDPQIARLPKDEKLIVVCLFSNIHSKSCGIYRITIDRIAAMTKINELEIGKALKKLADADIVYYDGNEICIPGFIRRQRYKGPKIARRIVEELALVKNLDFVEKIESRYPDFLHIGGHKKRESLSSKELFPGLGAADEGRPEGGNRAEQAEGLAEYIGAKLKFTAGIRPAVLEKLIVSAGGVDQVRMAIDRAAKYYETAKAEKWHSFIIARRFQKFCDYYDEAFASDEILDAYLSKIRAANAREVRQQKKDAHLQVGAHRSNVQAEPARDPWDVFMGKLPKPLEPIRDCFDIYRETKKMESIRARLLDLYGADPELNAKVKWFLSTLKPKQRTKEVEQNYRINFLMHKFGIPHFEEEK